MKSRATLPHLNYDNCKDCASKCEHAGKNREFLYSGERSCKVNGIARKIDREKWEPCEHCKYTPDDICRKCQNEICNAEYRYPCTGCNDQRRFEAKRFCQNCGRPLTEEAWAELERRFCGG